MKESDSTLRPRSIYLLIEKHRNQLSNIPLRFQEEVDILMHVRDIPLLSEEGWLRDQIMLRSHLCRADGVVKKFQQEFVCNFSPPRPLHRTHEIPSPRTPAGVRF